MSSRRPTVDPVSTDRVPADRPDRPVDWSSRRLGERAIGGILWASSGTVAHAVLQLAILMVLARLLEPATFGIVAAALMVVRLAGMISRLGVGVAIIQKPALDVDDVTTAFTFFLLGGLIMVGAVWLAAPALAGLFRMPALELVVAVMVLAVPLFNAGEIADALLSRELRFRQLAMVDVLAYALGYGVTGIGLAWLGFGIWSLVGAYLGQMTVRMLLYFHLRPHARALRLRRRTLRDLLRFGGGISIWRMTALVALELDKLVVGRWLGADALGLYGRAHHLSTTPVTFLNRALLHVLLPTLSQIQQQPARLARAYRRAVTITALATLPVSAVLAITAPEITALVLGDQWHAAGLPLSILALAIPLRVGARVADSLAVATAAVYATAWRQVVHALAVLVGALVGQAWGLGGVATGVLLAGLLNYALAAQLALRLTAATAGGFLAAHAPGLATAALVIPPVWLVDTGLTQSGQGAATILAANVATAALTMLLALRLIPDRILGSDGLWALEALLAKLPGPQQRLVRRLICPRLPEPAAPPPDP